MKRLAISVFTVLGILPGARATTLFYNLNDGSACSGGCGTAPFGTVELFQTDSTDVLVTVSLNTGSYFVDTGGPHRSFGFDVSGDPPIIVTGLTPDFSVDPNSAPNATYGPFNYAIDGPSPSDHCCSTLSFTVSLAGGISTSDFIANTDGYFFEADIYGGGTGNTGEIASNQLCAICGIDINPQGSGSPIPEPISLALVGAGLGAIALLKRRRLLKFWPT